MKKYSFWFAGVLLLAVLGVFQNCGVKPNGGGLNLSSLSIPSPSPSVVGYQLNESYKLAQIMCLNNLQQYTGILNVTGVNEVLTINNNSYELKSLAAQCNVIEKGNIVLNQVGSINSQYASGSYTQTPSALTVSGNDPCVLNYAFTPENGISIPTISVSRTSGVTPGVTTNSFAYVQFNPPVKSITLFWYVSQTHGTCYKKFDKID